MVNIWKMWLSQKLVKIKLMISKSVRLKDEKLKKKYTSSVWWLFQVMMMVITCCLVIDVVKH